jgi:hypothetical protein
LFAGLAVSWWHGFAEAQEDRIVIAPELLDVAQRSEQLYEQRLRAQLEPTHRGTFVTIEPTSEDYFLGRTLSEAVQAARRAHPDRLTYTLRIGFPTAVDFGNCSP